MEEGHTIFIGADALNVDVDLLSLSLPDEMVSNEYMGKALELKAPPRKRAQKGSIPRPLQNRASAQRVRDRQKAREQYLKNSVAALNTENTTLQERLESLNAMQESLSAELATLKAQVCTSTASMLAVELPTSPTYFSDYLSPYPLFSPVADLGTHTTTEPGTECSDTELSGWDTPCSSGYNAATPTLPTETEDYDERSTSSILRSPVDMQLSDFENSSSLDSCESAVLAYPQQQDVLRMMIMIQMMQTVSWASWMALLSAFKLTWTPLWRALMPLSLPPSCNVVASKAIKTVTNSGIGLVDQDVWSHRLAVT